MAISGLEIYKLLPKTNCRQCGYSTCLAFGLQLAKREVNLDKCPYVSEEAKKILTESSLPPIRLITLSRDKTQLEIGNETVLFRHEEKFHHPAGVGIILEDDLDEDEFKKRVLQINKLGFERIGQTLDLNLIALRQRQKDPKIYLERLNFVLENSSFIPVLMSQDKIVLSKAKDICRDCRCLVYCADANNYQDMVDFAKENNFILVVRGENLDELSHLVSKISLEGFENLVLDIGQKPLKDKIREFTQIRRQSLKRANRLLGYPILAVIENIHPYQQILEAVTLLAKYTNLILLKGVDPWQILTLLTFRQNLYADPQKPLQVEPKEYVIGNVTDKSPVLVTTNFSLTFYTVLPEIEASKIPSYLISVDTEGMSVLTSWAAEKFTPEKITEALKKCGMEEKVSHRRLIIPGYVAVMKADLEEKSGWQIIVGPREAAGIPRFLKNLS